jgi:hypothetical protein
LYEKALVSAAVSSVADGARGWSQHCRGKACHAINGSADCGKVYISLISGCEAFGAPTLDE